jgi:hypothetical protein
MQPWLTMAIIGWGEIITRQIYRNIVIDSLKYSQKEKGFELYG